jgi:tryptophanyl-tRNA synthetase
MQTDPSRVRRTDAGDPDKCPVWDLHKVYTDEDTKQTLAQGCRSAGIGCLDCKKPLIDRVVAETHAMHERAAPYVQDPKRIDAVLEAGAEKARATARATMAEVRQVMNLAPAVTP